MQLWQAMQAINLRNLPSLSTMPQPTPEYIYVEKPTIDQLQSMGWQYIEGSWDNPQVTDRENFKQVLISDRLRPILDTQIAALVRRWVRSGSDRIHKRLQQKFNKLRATAES